MFAFRNISLSVPLLWVGPHSFEYDDFYLLGYKEYMAIYPRRYNPSVVRGFISFRGTLLKNVSLLTYIQIDAPPCLRCVCIILNTSRCR
jgi:hypothetical protein